MSGLKESRQFYFFYSIIIVIYSLNIGGNAIWSTHEAYYAEVVRELLDSGNWLEFFFNYEPRFQKPPMTYWIMAISGWIFGLSETTLRLPIVGCSLLTVLMVYKIGNLLYDQKTGLHAMLIFAVSLQFVWFKSYASPEIPLTFFFLLSTYLYFKGVIDTNKSWIISAWIMIGLTALTKGYPYIFLFFIIIVIHRLLERENGYHFKPQILFIGFLISLSIGLSWPIYMTVNYGDQYISILTAETLGRFMNHTSTFGFFNSVLFYPQTILWSFFPFSLMLCYSIFKIVANHKFSKTLLLPIIWLIVFLIVFTLSSGKLPIYMLQAHPAMALIAGFVIVHSQPLSRFERIIRKLCFWLPGILLLASTYFIVSELNLSIVVLLPLLTGLSLSFVVSMSSFDKPTISLWALSAGLLVIVFTGILPWTEQFRPYKEIQKTINEIADPTIPIYVEARFLDNLPFYAGRKVFGGVEWNLERIALEPGEKLVLQEKRHPSTLFRMKENEELLWQGSIHAKGPEDHFFKFIRDCYLYSKGDSTRFKYYQLIHVQ